MEEMTTTEFSLESEPAPTEENTSTEVATLPEGDVVELSQSFPEVTEVESDELLNVERYVELRRLGLTEMEAYLATRKAAPREDNRSHLTPSVSKEARMPSSAMPECELRAARELFCGMSDLEIRRLYKRVSV